MLEISGTIKVIQPTQEISDRFRKRELVIEDNSGQYPQFIPLEFTQDKCEILDQFKEGDTVKVAFNLRGREWTNKQNETKYFLSLNAWKIESEQGGSAPQPSAPAPAQAQAASHSVSDMPAEEEDDDLPF
jgi:single-stranded DNA-binding protein